MHQMSEPIRVIAGRAAVRFGLATAEATDGRSFSLLFTGEKANQATFREVLGYLLMEHAPHQFSPQGLQIPGVHARGLTLDSMDVIYLVVVGDSDAARYVPMPTALRTEE